MTEEEKLVYLAGIIDGEGSVEISKDNSDRREATYRIRLEIGNTDRTLISWLGREFGGNKRWNIREKRNENCAEQHRWTSYGENAIELLEKVERFTIIKRRQIELARTFWNKTNRGCYRGKARPKWIKEFQEECYEKMKKLNQKGPKLLDEEARSSQDSTLDCPLADRQQMSLLEFYQKE